MSLSSPWQLRRRAVASFPTRFSSPDHFLRTVHCDELQAFFQFGFTFPLLVVLVRHGSGLLASAGGPCHLGDAFTLVGTTGVSTCLLHVRASVSRSAVLALRFFGSSRPSGTIRLYTLLVRLDGETRGRQGDGWMGGWVGGKEGEGEGEG